MNLPELIKAMIKHRGSSYANLSERMGYKKASSVSEVVLRGDTKISFLIRMCKVLDYEIIIRPKSGDNKAENTLHLDEYIERVDNRGSYDRGK